MLAVVFLCGTAFPQEKRDAPGEAHNIGEVVLTGRRITDMGATTTLLDTFALRQNVTYSLADVLSQNTPIFIKSYGRGTMATASFRGTAPSHTQVLWNGVNINSPMLGMVDFSLIPSYFIDEAAVLHGAASVNVAAGGLGGAVVLGTGPAKTKGFGLNYIQGFSSFNTYDQFLKASYGGGRLSLTTRLNYVVSDNDFKYTNYDKRPNPDGSYVVERNKSGHYRDFHVMQEAYYTLNGRDRLSGAVWLVHSDRGIPMLTVNYRDEDESKNVQRETSLRAIFGWERTVDKVSMKAGAGYLFSDVGYTYLGDVGTGQLQKMIDARSFIHTGYGSYGVKWFPVEKLMLSGDVSFYMHWVDSGEKLTLEHYEKSRAETSAKFAARYKPFKRLGIGAELREEIYGSKVAPPVCAGFVDFLAWPKYNVVAKASAARNYRYPTLNDLYFQPGGNAALKPERGYTYEGGVEFRVQRKRLDIGGGATVYNSRIDDWILWLPDFKGVWSPINVREVHSYGIELRGNFGFDFGRSWRLRLDANWSRTRSLNYGDPKSWTDESIGKQLVYIPEYSNAVTGQLSWRKWSFVYKYNYYSERFTTSSNETDSKVNRLGSYYMSDVSLEKSISLRFGDISLKICVYNLFNEEYVSVLSRPMARRNYGFFIGLTPKFKRHSLEK